VGGIRVLSYAADPSAVLEQTVAHLRSGGLIAYPTETVYGFGSSLSTQSLRELGVLKGRSDDKPFLLLVTERVLVPGVLWSSEAETLAKAFWPGALTLALPVSPGALPDEVVGGDGTVAVRCTSHPVPRALIDALAEPITSTSANRPGGTPARTAPAAVRAAEAGGVLDLIVIDGGELPESPPSTIVSFAGTFPRVVRRGAISVEELRRFVKDIQ
jgi:L-threonylcarbamoyladenylate synthase